ncbi:MAG TPA: hypothetical protein VLK65_22655 [Vicinamibacteria bacterium]|nr:hypothetical protein [Vicinamibacteria bacterium]
MTKLGEWIVIATLVSLWACGSPEQATIDQFFRAAQSNDQSTLAAMAAVGPPGEIESWKVVEVSSQTSQPFALPELLERFKVAETERDAILAKRKKYFEDNQDALEQIIPKQQNDPNYKFRGKLGEVQEEWLRLLDERNEKETTFQELKRTVDRESSLANKSVMRQLSVGSLEGNVAVTEMLVSLKPKGHGELPYKVTLRKYDLSEPGSGRTEPARWIIADIEGTTEEARAAAAPARTREPAAAHHEATSEPKAAPEPAAATAAPVEVAESAAAGEPAQEAKHMPRELRGLARVQILAPETNVTGEDVVSKVRARNVSKDWITRFTVTEFWYDQQGGVAGSSSRTHQGRFMPDEIIEMELRTRKSPTFFQNQFEFSHANGDVDATVVGSFPAGT